MFDNLRFTLLFHGNASKMLLWFSSNFVDAIFIPLLWSILYIIHCSYCLASFQSLLSAIMNSLNPLTFLTIKETVETVDYFSTFLRQFGIYEYSFVCSFVYLNVFISIIVIQYVTESIVSTMVTWEWCISRNEMATVW